MEQSNLKDQPGDAADVALNSLRCLELAMTVFSATLAVQKQSITSLRHLNDAVDESASLSEDIEVEVGKLVVDHLTKP